MDKELEDKIIAIAPHMFVYEGSTDMTKSLMCFGFDCGNGWYEIFRELFTKLEAIDTEKQIRVVQIKEKYGSLRVYLGSYFTDEIDKLIREAEIASSKTCEVCGKEAATMTFDHWCSTLCQTCRTGDHK